MVRLPVREGHGLAVLGFRSRLDPLDVAVYDSFVRANQSGLGVTSDGQYSWQVVNGVWSIASNKAHTTTSASSNPLAVIDPGYSDVDISLGVSPSGNDAIYFRVVDANNWLRLKVREYTSVQTYTTYCSGATWGYDSNIQGYAAGCGSCSSGWQVFACDAACNSVTGCQSGACTGLGSCSCVFTCTASSKYCTGYGGCVSKSNCTYACGTGTNYYYNYYLDLEKMVGGSLSSIANISLGLNRNVTQTRVVAVGSKIEVFSDGTTTTGTQELQGTYTDATNSTATKHGIGRGASNAWSGDASSLSDFSITLGE